MSAQAATPDRRRSCRVAHLLLKGGAQAVEATEMPAPSAKVNNYDIIRLVAAVQVLYIHAVIHLHLAQPQIVVKFVKLFPGVPIFYFLSGVLISTSWENNSRIAEYFRNRALRIYPGLVVCTLVAVSSAFAAGYLWNGQARLPQFVGWIIGQMTFVQFFNPDFMRRYGSGVLNGSLSTITTELQFYVLVPLTYVFFGFNRRSRRLVNVTLGALIIVFLLANKEFNRRGGQQTEIMSMKLLDVSFIPWFYMFLTGVLVQRNFRRILPLVRGKAPAFGIVYVVAAWMTRDHLGWKVSNAIYPVIFVLLITFVLSCAYTSPTLADRALRRNDISYGVYIYHMPIVNLLAYEGGSGKNSSLLIVMAVTATLAALSWRFVERPMMRRKRTTSHSVTVETPQVSAPADTVPASRVDPVTSSA
jgi:peptidoglycan/LPS O-acetylase OafA/YrhL